MIGISFILMLNQKTLSGRVWSIYNNDVYNKLTYFSTPFRVAGQMKIIDFGLARQINNSEDKLISSNPMPGTYHYVAPENFRLLHANGEFVSDLELDDDDDRGDTHVQLTLKADIWSIGIILYKMVYGLHPYAAVSGGRVSKIFALKSFTEIEFATLQYEKDRSKILLRSLKASLRKDPKERENSEKLLSMMTSV